MTTVAWLLPETLPLAGWYCGNCGYPQPLLGKLSPLGAVAIRIPNRADCRAQQLIVIDLPDGRLIVHCGRCHSWRLLSYVREARSFRDAAWDGPAPAVCPARASA